MCQICFERQIETLLPCFHAYCARCIDDWRAKDDTCPMCRAVKDERGSFNILMEQDDKVKEEIKRDLMRELTQIVS